MDQQIIAIGYLLHIASYGLRGWYYLKGDPYINRKIK